MARVVLTGATGTIGRSVCAALLARGDQVIALSRDADRARTTLDAAVDVHSWPDPEHEPAPATALAGADAVLNLLGEPIAQRWSPRAKREIRDSRVLGTGSLVATLVALPDEQRPATLISQSAVGFYGPRDDHPVGEQAPPGSDFLAETVVAWERAARAAEAAARVVLTRTGVVLSPRGGALAQMLLPFRLGLGGPIGGGRQYVPWVHIDDVVGVLLYCIDHPGVNDAVNLTAPTPVTNAELARALGRVLRRPAVLPLPGPVLRLLYGEMAEVVLTGQRAIPERLLASGYRFLHSDLENALRDVLGRK